MKYLGSWWIKWDLRCLNKNGQLIQMYSLSRGVKNNLIKKIEFKKGICKPFSVPGSNVQSDKRTMKI
jgi:hypothetical protein